MVQFHTIAAQLALAAPAMSQSSQTRSASANPTSAPYAIPVTGLSSGNSTKWGVNTTLEDLPVGRDNPIVPLSVVIGTQPQATIFPVRRKIVDGAEPPFELFAEDDGTETLYLGSNSDLAASSKDSELIQIPTVPFGLNLGSANTWNGSIIVNGHFDANRVNSTSWIEVSADGDDEKQFLKKGTLGFSGRVQDKDSSFILDFNHHAIVLPDNYSCKNITIQPEDASYAISIPDSLLNEDNCYTRDSGNAKKHINLGWPFFQAAYLYAAKDGSVYLAQANDYDLPAKPEKFEAKGELSPPAAPGGGNNTNSPSPTSTASGTLPSGTSPTTSSPPEATGGAGRRVLDEFTLAAAFIGTALMGFLCCGRE